MVGAGGRGAVHRARVSRPPQAEETQQVTGNTVESTDVDRDYTGPNAAETAQQRGIRLEVVHHPLAKRGFVLLPRRGR